MGVNHRFRVLSFGRSCSSRGLGVVAVVVAAANVHVCALNRLAEQPELAFLFNKHLYQYQMHKVRRLERRG